MRIHNIEEGAAEAALRPVHIPPPSPSGYRRAVRLLRAKPCALFLIWSGFICLAFVICYLPMLLMSPRNTPGDPVPTSAARAPTPSSVPLASAPPATATTTPRPAPRLVEKRVDVSTFRCLRARRVIVCASKAQRRCVVHCGTHEGSIVPTARFLYATGAVSVDEEAAIARKCPGFETLYDVELIACARRE